MPRVVGASVPLQGTILGATRGQRLDAVWWFGPHRTSLRPYCKPLEEFVPLGGGTLWSDPTPYNCSIVSNDASNGESNGASSDE